MDCAFSVVTEFSSSGEEEYPKGEVVAILLLTILLLSNHSYLVYTIDVSVILSEARRA